jgi:hypothetical protein
MGSTSDVANWSIDEEKVNVTLEKYFNEVNERTDSQNSLIYEPGRWFGSGAMFGGKFNDASRDYELSGKDRNKLVTTFAFAESPDDITVGPQLRVESPVELRIIDRVSGRAYASSSNVAVAGDILVAKVSADLVAPIEDESEPVPSDDFPPYTLFLPDALIGKNLNLEIFGIADGDYAIALFPGDPDLVSSVPLVGSILSGQTAFGSFEVSAASELMGDYDGNGAVDAADYVSWRNTLGQMGTGLVADGNNNGEIDSGDYAVWKAHFGETAPGRGRVSALPEPTIAMYFWLALGYGVWITRCRFRRCWKRQHMRGERSPFACPTTTA